MFLRIVVRFLVLQKCVFAFPLCQALRVGDFQFLARGNAPSQLGVAHQVRQKRSWITVFSAFARHLCQQLLSSATSATAKQYANIVILFWKRKPLPHFFGFCKLQGVKACSKNSPQRFNRCSLYCSSLSFCFYLSSFAFSFSRIVHYAPSRSKQNLLS